MKVVIFGATGFVGANLLKSCIASSQITEIICISRRPAPADIASEEKVNWIVHDDFLSYPKSLLSQLIGAQACGWCIGGRHTQTSRWPTMEEYRRVSIDYTVAAAQAFATQIAPTLENRQKPFRFVFCSGHATELDASKQLWILSPTRKVKGEAENALYKIAAENENFGAYSARPCGIYQPQPSMKDRFLTTFVLPSLSVEALCATMLDVMVNGFETAIIEHDTLKRHGQRLLDATTDKRS